VRCWGELRRCTKLQAHVQRVTHRPRNASTKRRVLPSIAVAVAETAIGQCNRFGSTVPNPPSLSMSVCGWQLKRKMAREFSSVVRETVARSLSPESPIAHDVADETHPGSVSVSREFGGVWARSGAQRFGTGTIPP